MLPIPYLFIPKSGWSGTYSQPNFLWYDYGAATASTDTNNKNTVSGGQYTFMWDFSGNTRHSDLDSDMFYFPNASNGLPAARGTASFQGVNAFTGTFSGDTFTLIAIGDNKKTSSSNMRAFVYNEIVSSDSSMMNWTETFNVGGITYSRPYVEATQMSTSTFPDTYTFVTYSTPRDYTLFGQKIKGRTASVFTEGLQSTEKTLGTASGSGFAEVGVRLNGGTSSFVYELMIWDRHLTDNEINDVFGYLKNKWLGL